MADEAQRTVPAVESMYRLVLLLAPAVDGFPRGRKFLLGDRLQTTALDVLERRIDATYTRDRPRRCAAAGKRDRRQRREPLRCLAPLPRTDGNCATFTATWPGRPIESGNFEIVATSRNN